jgi:hypothetical protein
VLDWVYSQKKRPFSTTTHHTHDRSTHFVAGVEM